MRPKGSAELLADRRRRALKLLRERLSLNEVARRIKCAASSVMRWRNAWRRRGADALKVRFSPGRPRRLTPRQQQRLVRILLRGAIANGYRTELWTTKRVAEVIQETFDIPCHYNTDESGFLMAPLVVRTWAPRGSTPFLRYRQGRREKISVISGISLSPERHRLGLYYLLFYENIGEEEVCVFLRELLRQLRGPLIVLLDNSSTHNEEGELLEKLLARHPRLHIEHFPCYAPELNPDEGVWALAKKELANGCPKNADELMESIICTIDGIRKSPAKLQGCILQSDLPLFLRRPLHYLM